MLDGVHLDNKSDLLGKTSYTICEEDSSIQENNERILELPTRNRTRR